METPGILLTPERSREAFDRMIEIGHPEVAEEMIRNKEVNVDPNEQKLLLATAYENKAKILREAEKLYGLDPKYSQRAIEQAQRLRSTDAPTPNPV